MQTFVSGQTIFSFNSDLSGDVHIKNESGEKFCVPGRDILSFVAEHVRRQRISDLEDADDLTVIGLKS